MEEHTALSISRSLTRLIEARLHTTEAREQLDRFKPTGPPEYHAAVFEDVQSLANYSNKVSEYQRILERLTTEYQERKQEYEAAQEEVADFLPAGKSIVHEYQGEYYDIKRDGADRLTVRLMNIEEYQRRRQRPKAF